MVKISLSLPDDVKKIMEKHKDINWSEMALDYLWEYAKKIDLAEKIASESKLTEDEAGKISRTVKQRLAIKYRS